MCLTRACCISFVRDLSCPSITFLELNQPGNATCPSCLLRQPTDLETNHFLSQIFVLEREALERRKKSSWVRVVFQAWSLWLEPLDPSFEVRILISFGCSCWSSSCIAWSDLFCMSCIVLKLVLERENGFSCVLEQSPILIEEFGTKIMFCVCSCLTFLNGYPGPYFELLAWNSDFCNKLWACIHLSMIMFFMFFKGKPRFSRLCFDWGHQDHTSARRCGTSTKTWLVPSVFSWDGSSV